MRIIRRGVLPEEKIYRASCNHCKTEVEFTGAEGRLKYDQRDGNFYTVTCPVCNNLITKDAQYYIGC
jgi:RNase P subunit RPR2